MIQESIMKRSRLIFLGISFSMVLVLVAGSLIGDGAEDREKTYSSLKTFTHSLRLVDRHYVDEVEMERVMQGAYRGLVERLDPFSSWIPASTLEKIEARGGDADVGLSLVKASNGFLRVVSVRYGSPAWEAGIRPGRWLEQIDKKPAKEVSLFEAHSMLRGEEGSEVSLGFFLEDEEESEENRNMITLARKSSPAHLLVAQLESEQHADKAHLRLLDLAEGAAVALAEELTALKERGAKKLVLDLRSNPGGSLEELIRVADLFVPSGELLQVHARSDEGAQSHNANPGTSWDGELAILIGPGTLGEAEALALTLKENKRASLVGGRTVGKGFRQQLVTLPDGSAVHLSVREMRGPAGVKVQGDGVKPDIDAKDDEDTEGDETLEAALESLDAGNQELAPKAA